MFKQHARSEAVSTLVWAFLLALIGFYTVFMYQVMQSSGSLADLQKVLEQAPGVLKAMIGGSGLSLFSFDGWVQGYALGTWVALPYSIFTALFVAGMVTREMDRRTIEFVLSLPVSRAQLIISRYLVLAASLVLTHAAHLAGLVAGAAALGEAGQPGRYAVAILNSLLVYLFIGSLLLLVSLFIDDYGPGSGTLLGLGLGLNLLYMATAEATGALKSIREFLPLSFYDAQAIVMNGVVPWGDMAILGAGALLFLGLSIWVFQRKQIAV